jgi:hypothetical protein
LLLSGFSSKSLAVFIKKGFKFERKVKGSVVVVVVVVDDDVVVDASHDIRQ